MFNSTFFLSLVFIERFKFFVFVFTWKSLNCKFAMGTSTVVERQPDNDDRDQCCNCLNNHNHETSIGYLKKRFLRPCMIAFTAGIGGLFFGYYSAIVYANSFFPKEFKRSPWRFSMQIEASNMLYIPFGAMSLAAFLVDMSNDNAGRLGNIGFVDLLAIVFVPLFNVYIVDQFITMWGMILVGCVGGMTMITFPIYISELSSPTTRGAFVSTIFLQITGGKILYYLINLYSSVKKDQTWNWKFGIIPGIIHVIVLIAGGIPESPRWLYRKGYEERAVEILNTLRSPCEVSREVKAMQLSMEAEIAKEGSIDDHGAWYDTEFAPRGCFRRFNELRANVPYKRLVAGIGCLVAQHFVGMNMIMHYSYTVFRLIGGGLFNSDDEMAEQAALAIPLITSVFSVVGTIFCIVLVDRCGRRRLLLISIFGIMISLGLLSYVFSSGVEANDLGAMDHIWYNKEEGISGFGILALIALAMYFIFYSVGIEAVPWIINSEIYPMKYRTVGGVRGMMVYWASKIVVHIILDVIGYFVEIVKMLFLLQFFSCLVGLFIYLYVPETKGFPLEDMEKLLLQQEKNNKLRECDGECKDKLIT